MERIRRLAAFWNWLPAFRAVAELEHLPSAAEEFRVSPSALSRSVRQLEEAIGLPLFDREGRLLLNDSGRELLRVIRRAMLIVDEGIENVTSPELSGTLRIAARGSFATMFVVPATSELCASHPRLTPEVNSSPDLKANAEIHAGRIDVAVLDDPIPEEGLVVERIAEVSYGIYCGAGHPMYLTTPSHDAILLQPFVAPLLGQNDHWPPDVVRIVGARFDFLHHGLELCAAGSYLAVLPDRVAALSGRQLHRLPFEGGLPPTTVYAVYRKPIGARNKTELVLEAIRRAANA